MNSIGVLLVDDEQINLDRHRRFVNRASGFHVVGEAATGEEALKLCHELQPGIVLMDINMPGMGGMEAARQLKEEGLQASVIFCTGYGEYALDAFGVDAVDFLKKPFNYEKLANALEKARRIRQLEQIAESPRRKEPTIVYTSGKDLVRVPIADVLCFVADQKYVSALLVNGSEALLDETLKQLEEDFDDEVLRVHRNTLVVRRQVQGLERTEEGDFVVLKDADYRPQVSRRHLSDVKRLIKS